VFGKTKSSSRGVIAHGEREGKRRMGSCPSLGKDVTPNCALVA
jgi:hypothetical protein